SFHEVCWSYAEGWLLFGTLSEKAAEDFEELFKQTFNLQLVPHVPWDPALLEPEIIESLSSAGNQSSLRSIDNGN
ncbi:MAG: hypothetical protein QM324_04620, partial [Bacteroidota bacterium]|nr:hypothetical protein [Bacteroidota bacterium]